MTVAGKITSNALSQEDALDGLLEYCKEQHVIISSSIAAQRVPGRGLGIYTREPIKRGDQLVHVPTKALLTIKSIPESFLPKTVRDRFTVHCALAAYLAFGPEEDLLKYQRWMATWPKLEEFTETLPVFWLDDLRKPEHSTFRSLPTQNGRARKRRKTLSNVDDAAKASTARFSRSLGVDDLWLTLPEGHNSKQHKNHLAEQAAKIRACLATIDKHMPDINITEPSSHSLYLRFLYTWSCVNTRCFYYLRPGQAAPEDSNEAMALCPFQDLFNHSDARGCYSVFDKRGFFIRADKDYDAGEELFLRYGKHSNDMLWMEYGFTMDENKDDYVRIDPVILAALSDDEKDHLDKADYLGNYTLKKDGVCYRSLMASYIGVLSGEQWQRAAMGTIDPETSTAYTAFKLRAKKRTVNWILSARKEAEENLKVLTSMNDNSQTLASFLGNASLTEKQQHSSEMQLEVARARKRMCVHRWKQIFDLCMCAVREIESEHPGSFMVDDLEHLTKQDLEQTAEQFVSGLGKSGD